MVNSKLSRSQQGQDDTHGGAKAQQIDGKIVTCKGDSCNKLIF